MADINKVILIGNLCRDMEKSYLKSGTACGHFSMAVNERRKNGNAYEDYANYFDVTLWGKSAENLEKYLCKGKKVAVVGRLQQQRWEKDGQKNSKVVIIAESVQLLGGNGNSSSEPDDSDAGEIGDVPF